MIEGKRMKKLSFVLTLSLLLFFELSAGEVKIQNDEYELRVTGYDYGQVMIGQTALSDNCITNVGTRNFTIYGFEILGNDSLCFQFLENISFPYILEIGESCVVHFRFSPTEAKAFTVIVNVKYDGLEQAVFDLIGNGIISDIGVGQNRNVVISPNPATDYIEINHVILNEVKDPEIKVFDVLGIKYIDTRLRGNDIFVSSEGNIRIDVSSLPPGIYFLKIGSLVSKFVVMR